jgi:hypothetical protein
MARGFESKSVEAQQTAREEHVAAATDKAAKRSAGAETDRRLQELKLQRERILSERTSSAHRRSALTSALASIEEELAELGWTVHM